MGRQRRTRPHLQRHDRADGAPSASRAWPALQAELDVGVPDWASRLASLFAWPADEAGDPVPRRMR